MRWLCHGGPRDKKVSGFVVSSYDIEGRINYGEKGENFKGGIMLMMFFACLSRLARHRKKDGCTTM